MSGVDDKPLVVPEHRQQKKTHGKIPWVLLFWSVASD